MSILLEYAGDILLEAYYGKPKEFTEIEKELEKIIKMIKDNVENPTKADLVNESKELKKIETLFTKFFKNNETSITFYSLDLNTIAMAINPADIDIVDRLPYGYNAYTYPSILSYFKKDSSNKKIRTSDDLFINVNVDMGLVYSLDLSAKELMSLILHEIGHCFDASLFSFLAQFNIQLLTTIFNSQDILQLVFNLIGAGIGFALRDYAAKGTQILNRIYAMSPEFNKFMVKFRGIAADIKENLYLGKFIDMVASGKFSLSWLNFVNPTNLFGYSGEKFADSFATSYGYGPDLITAFNKMQQKKGYMITNIAQKIPVLNIGHDLARVSAKVAFMLCDPHPDDAVRIKSQLNKLKRDINDPNLTPKVKKELLDNIKEMESFIDDIYLKFDKNENHLRPVSFLWNTIVFKLFDGKIDPRELLDLTHYREL